MHRSLSTLRLVALLAVSGCAPAFQDARLVGPGHVEVTPSFNGVAATSDGESEYLAHTFAAQAQVGIHDRVNLGVGYARFEEEHFDAGINGLGFGPKFAIVPDRFAVSVPISFMFGEDIPVSETWQLHPMALFTLPMSQRVDFNPSARLLVPLCDECDVSDTLVGLNAGFGFRTGPRVTIRPEVGALFNPGESGVVWTFGLGVSIRDH